MTRPGALSLACIFFAMLWISPIPGVAQAIAPADPWDIFGGGSYLRTLGSAPANAFGWHASVTERPYPRYPWFGGSFESSGDYNGSSTAASTSTSVYNIAFGPVVTLPHARIKPFAHALFGELWTRSATDQPNATIRYFNSSATTAGQSTSTKRNVAYTLGGGIDAPVAPRWAVRIQADWLRSKSISYIRTSTGLVYSF